MKPVTIARDTIDDGGNDPDDGEISPTPKRIRDSFVRYEGFAQPALNFLGNRTSARLELPRTLSKAARVKPEPVIAPPKMPKSHEGLKPMGTVPWPESVTDRHAYAMHVDGNCMAPEILDGDLVLCSPAAKIVEGGVVAFYWKDKSKPAIKRLVTPLFPAAKPNDEIEMAIGVERNDQPGRRYYIIPSKLDVVHAVIGYYRGNIYTPLKPRRVPSMVPSADAFADLRKLKWTDNVRPL